MSLLNSHPHINAFEELFLNRPAGERLAWVAEGSPDRFFYFRKQVIWPRPISIFLYLKSIQKYDLVSDAVGFKLMLSQARSSPELFLALAMNRYRIIFLNRSNIFERHISHLLRKSSGIPHSQEAVSNEPIRVEPAQLIQEMRRMSRRLTLANRLIRISPFPSLQIEYDELRADPAKECRRIFKFLDLDEGVDVSSKLKKRVTVPYSALISNYSEVRDALSRAGMDGYLKSDPPATAPEPRPLSA